MEEIEKLKLKDKSGNLKFSVSIWMTIKKTLCENNLSNREKFLMKIYENSQKFINNKMDVMNYLYFFQEFLNMKCLLFSHIQTLCLEFLEKPKLHEKSRFTKLNARNNKRMKEIIKYFLSKSDFSYDDSKFYDLLTPDIKEIITKLNTS